MKITKKSLYRYLTQKKPEKYKRKASIEARLIKFLTSDPSYNIAGRLNEIVHHGCSSGCIGELIYTADIVCFYAKYESQIWDIVSDYVEGTGQTFGQFWDSMQVDITDPNLFRIYLSWFAIENLASEILNHQESYATNSHHAALRAEGGEVLPKSKEENQCKQIA